MKIEKVIKKVISAINNSDQIVGNKPHFISVEMTILFKSILISKSFKNGGKFYGIKKIGKIMVFIRWKKEIIANTNKLVGFFPALIICALTYSAWSEPGDCRIGKLLNNRSQK